ncbi:MAG: hypothetical protein K2V38_29890, partial [Gemmataceae bacterium]|nr:hypothetical protein [Gemmataceae bacterium]
THQTNQMAVSGATTGSARLCSVTLRRPMPAATLATSSIEQKPAVPVVTLLRGAGAGAGAVLC